MPLVWVTGSSGVGKSTACAILKTRGGLAVDADFEGYSHWVDRTSGQIVTDPPYPARWLAKTLRLEDKSGGGRGPVGPVRPHDLSGR